MNYEVNWCARLARLGFEGIALYGDASANNPTHKDWKSLMQINYPYLKKELLRDNPLKMDLQQIPALLFRGSLQRVTWLILFTDKQ